MRRQTGTGVLLLIGAAALIVMIVSIAASVS